MFRVVALSLAAVLVILTLGRAARSWPRDSHLGYAEGIWLGLAIDASHGVLYRPIDGPEGIGGSRYFPLYYLAIAAVISLGVAPIVAGYLITTVSVGVLVSGMFVLMRRLGVDSVLAIVASAAALACQPLQMAFLATRGDALAAGLAIWGLASCVNGGSGWRAPVFFALAFATKPTSVYAPMAAVVWMIVNGHAAAARQIVWRTAVAAAAWLGVFVIASDGRMLSVLAASSGGGASFATVLAAPISAAHILARVPEAAVFILGAASFLLLRLMFFRRLGVQIDQVAWVVCAVVTLAIYASPATIENHLIDLTTLSVVVFAIRARHVSPLMTLSPWLLVIFGILAGVMAFQRSRTEDTVDRRALRADVLSALTESKSPILFDQPMLAVQRGEAPYVLDQYMSATRFRRDPTAVDSLVRDLDRRKFGAIVFENQAVDLSIADAFPGEAGARFKAALDETYRLDKIVAGRPIYRPK